MRVDERRGMSEGSQRYCGNCGTEIRSGISFCVSCGQQVEGKESRTEANGSFANMGSGSRGGSFLDQRNVRLLLLGRGGFARLGGVLSDPELFP